MQVLSLSDFVNNADKYMSREQTAPVEIENDGVRFVLMRKNAAPRGQSKKQGSLERARKEADALMTDPNAKTYDSPRELWAELGLI